MSTAGPIYDAAVPLPVAFSLVPASGDATADFLVASLSWKPGRSYAPIDPAQFTFAFNGSAVSFTTTALGGGAYAISARLNATPLQSLSFKATAKNTRGFKAIAAWSATARAPFGNVRGMGEVNYRGGAAAQAKGETSYFAGTAVRSMGEISVPGGAAAQALGDLPQSPFLASQITGEIGNALVATAARALAEMNVMPWAATNALGELLVGFSGFAADRVKGQLTVISRTSAGAEGVVVVGVPSDAEAQYSLEVQGMIRAAVLTALEIAFKGPLGYAHGAVEVGFEVADAAAGSIEAGDPVKGESPGGVEVQEGSGPALHVTVVNEPLAQARDAERFKVAPPYADFSSVSMHGTFFYFRVYAPPGETWTPTKDGSVFWMTLTAATYDDGVSGAGVFGVSLALNPSSGSRRAVVKVGDTEVWITQFGTGTMPLP